MKNPAQAKKVIFSGMGCLLVLFLSFSTLGYLVYGDRVKGSIHLNLCGTTELTTRYSVRLTIHYHYVLSLKLFLLQCVHDGQVGHICCHFHILLGYVLCTNGFHRTLCL